ncbi:hypothetical protein H6F43_14105 [Leptolyngbya sp. FACHB-36]|nr:hypothetical protein [Leptolyngbya sp. FACHB-36]
MIQVTSISRADRWQAHSRLTSLCIPCQCLADGYLQVSIDSPIAILQLKSVVRQLTAPRTELLQWLERCWESES